MNPKAMVPLALAVVLGLAAALLARSMMNRKPTVAGGPANLVTVVVAKQDADPGRALGPEDVGTAKVPADTLTGGVFSDPAQLVGRVTTAPLVKGQMVLDTLLAPTGSAAGLSAVIPTGMRAMTLEVTEYSGVGGMLEPGCRVDVMCIVHDDRAKQTNCRTVLQNIKVSAIGRNIAPPRPANGQPPPPPSNSVTLLCTPKQAQTLQLATSTGRPWLVLRSTRDGAELPLESTTMAELSGTPNGGAETIDQPPTDQVAVETPAAVPAVPPTTNPATPVVDAAPVYVPATIRRMVTVINGGVETQVAVTVPNPRAQITPDTADIKEP